MFLKSSITFVYEILFCITCMCFSSYYMYMFLINKHASALFSMEKALPLKSSTISFTTLEISFYPLKQIQQYSLYKFQNLYNFQTISILQWRWEYFTHNLRHKQMHIKNIWCNIPFHFKKIMNAFPVLEKLCFDKDNTIKSYIFTWAS